MSILYKHVSLVDINGKKNVQICARFVFQNNGQTAANSRIYFKSTYYSVPNTGLHFDSKSHNSLQKAHEGSPGTRFLSSRLNRYVSNVPEVILVQEKNLVCNDRFMSSATITISSAVVQSYITITLWRFARMQYF